MTARNQKQGKSHDCYLMLGNVWHTLSSCHWPLRNEQSSSEITWHCECSPAQQGLSVTPCVQFWLLELQFIEKPMVFPGQLKHTSIISITLVIYLYLWWYYIFLVLAPEGSLPLVVSSFLKLCKQKIYLEKKEDKKRSSTKKIHQKISLIYL